LRFDVDGYKKEGRDVKPATLAELVMIGKCRHVTNG
jgi:hypothetical protein